jgi:hypothetical protein
LFASAQSSLLKTEAMIQPEIKIHANTLSQAEHKAPAKYSWMMPKEHGAYAELALPMLTVLLGVHPNWTTLLYAIATVAFFLAHEPLLVVLGQRGRKQQREQFKRARLHLAVRTLVGVLGGAIAFGMSSWQQRIWLLPSVGLFLLVSVAVKMGKEKTAWGELTATVCFTSVSLVLGTSVGLGWQTSCLVMAVWTFTFWLATLAVRSTSQSRKQIWPWERFAALVGSLVVLLVSGWLLAKDLRPWALALLFPSALSFVLGILQPHPRHLRRMGWGVVAVTMITLGCSIWGLRLL